MATTFTFEEVAQEPATFTFEDLQTNKAPVKAQPIPIQAREFQFSDILAVPAAIGEVGLQMGTGLASQVAGGYRGLASILSGEGVDEAARKVTEVTEGGTYQPQTTLGQGASQAIAYPFQKGMELTKQAGGAIGGAIGGEQGRIAGEAIGEQVIPVAATVAPLKPVLQGALSRPSAAKMSAKIEEIQKAAPKIEVAREGAKIGMVFDVSEVNPNAPLMSKVGSGARLDMLAAKKNAEAAMNKLKQEIGIDPDVNLSKESVKQVISESGKAYDAVRGIGELAPNKALADSLRSKAPTPIRGLEKQVKEGNRVVSEIADSIESGEMTSSQAVEAIKGYRDQAKNWYKIAEKGDAKRNPKAIADAYKSVSDSLESLLEANIKDKAVLDNFRAARERIAKAYTVESIINPKTGIPDLSKLTTSRFSNAPFTGVLKTLKDVAETFPEATAAINKYGDYSATIPRTSRGGTVGAMAGSATGNAAGGSSIGASLQVIGDRVLRNRLLSPEYQRANLLPEYARYINEGRIQSPLTQSMPRAVPSAPTSGMLGIGLKPRIKLKSQGLLYGEE